MSRNAYDAQKDFALSSGLRSEIIWDALAADQHEILKAKIKTIIPDTGKNQNAIKKMRDDLFQNIWLQRKYTNKTLLSTIIYVLVTNETTSEKAKFSTSYSCHPVFRTRKCMNLNKSAGCCMIFIDETGRIYKDWNAYINNNVLPEGIMVVPRNGVYSFDANKEVCRSISSPNGKKYVTFIRLHTLLVQLDYFPTVSTFTSSKILSSTDTVAGVGGLVATVPMAAAIAFPIAAPIMAAATAITLTTAAYCTLRSVMQLTDRHKHGQSNALTDRTARSNWIGVAGGVVGLGASGATKALTYASGAGQRVTLATKLAVSGINVSSILLSGTGVVNGVYDLVMKVKDDEKLSGLDVLHLASSLLVFTHSINNLRIASKIAAFSKGSTIRREYRTQIRNAFKKITNHTSGLQGDIIRTVNDIPLKDALLSLHKINLHLSPTALTNLACAYIPKIIFHISENCTDINIKYLAEEFGLKFVQHVTDTDSLLDVLNAMAAYLKENAFRLLMNLARTFIEDKSDLIDQVLNTFISTETVLFKIFMHCVSNYSRFTYEYLEIKSGEILNEVEKYFNTLNPMDNQSTKRKCQQCKGFFYVCEL